MYIRFFEKSRNESRNCHWWGILPQPTMWAHGGPDSDGAGVAL